MCRIGCEDMGRGGGDRPEDDKGIWDLKLDVGPLLYGFICLVVPCTLAMC